MARSIEILQSLQSCSRFDQDREDPTRVRLENLKNEMAGIFSFN